MYATKLSAVVAVVLSFLCFGCASRSPAERGVFLPTAPVRHPSSTEAAVVTVALPERVVWENFDGPMDDAYSVTYYRPNGVLKARYWMWNHRTKAINQYDVRGRLRSCWADHAYTIFNLSATPPSEFSNVKTSYSLKGVYIVGNKEVTDADVLALFEEPQIKWMIVERCRGVTRTCLKTIKSKLVKDFPESLR